MRAVRDTLCVMSATFVYCWLLAAAAAAAAPRAQDAHDDSLKEQRRSSFETGRIEEPDSDLARDRFEYLLARMRGDHVQNVPTSIEHNHLSSSSCAADSESQLQDASVIGHRLDRKALVAGAENDGNDGDRLPQGFVGQNSKKTPTNDLEVMGNGYGQGHGEPNVSIQTEGVDAVVKRKRRGVSGVRESSEETVRKKMKRKDSEDEARNTKHARSRRRDRPRSKRLPAGRGSAGRKKVEHIIDVPDMRSCPPGYVYTRRRCRKVY